MATCHDYTRYLKNSWCCYMRIGAMCSRFIHHMTDIRNCSLPSPSLKPACSGVELPAHSCCHAHCWNLRSHTRAPFYWTRDYSAGIGSPPPSFITNVATIKFELWSEWNCLSSVFSSAPSKFLSYSSSGLLSQTVHVASCWRPQQNSTSLLHIQPQTTADIF